MPARGTRFTRSRAELAYVTPDVVIEHVRLLQKRQYNSLDSVNFERKIIEFE